MLTVGDFGGMGTVSAELGKCSLSGSCFVTGYQATKLAPLSFHNPQETFDNLYFLHLTPVKLPGSGQGTNPFPQVLLETLPSPFSPVLLIEINSYHLHQESLTSSTDKTQIKMFP